MREEENDLSAYVKTDHSTVTLSWDNGQYVKTVPLNSFTNVAIMYSTPAYTRALRAYPSVVVSDDEDEDNPNEDTSETPTASPTNWARSTPERASNYRQTTRPRPTTFEPPIDTIPHRIEPEEDQMEGQLSPQQLYQLWHHGLNHLSYSRMNLMIRDSLLPAVLKGVKPPKCHSCLLG